VMRIILLADDKSRRLSSATQQAKDYYPYSILHKITPTTNQSYLQDQSQTLPMQKNERQKNCRHLIKEFSL
jgi:hypothetical protein